MKVSIIVPVYNSFDYLNDCLYSLVNQTLKDIEIIVIDDASTDNSYQIMEYYQNKYPNVIKIFKNSINKGQSYTRNKGIELASGEYIGFLDSDDFVNFNMYETMYNGALDNNKPDILTSGLLFVKDNFYLKNNFKDLRRDKGRIYRPLTNPDYIINESPSVCNKLFKKELLNNIRFLDGMMWEDIAFTYTALFKANTILEFPNSDYFYRKQIDRGVSSLGFKPNNRLLNIFDVLDYIIVKVHEFKSYEIYQEQVNFLCISYSLLRVVEIMNWDIHQNIKDELIIKMLTIINNKYGNFMDYDFAQLSGKVGYRNLQILKEYMENMEKLGNK